MDELFFELMQVAIGNRVCLSHSPTTEEWKVLYDIAKKQSLVGVCFASVQKLIQQEQTPAERLYLEWMGMVAIIQQRNQIVDEQCVVLQKQLTKDKLRSCILKGQGVALLYDEQLRGLRQSGDIDVWLDTDAESCITYARNQNPKCSIGRKHVSLDIFDKSEVELHWIPSQLDNPIKNRKLMKWYHEQKEAQFMDKNDQPFNTPTIEFNLVYLLLHIYEHFLYEGIGLRQIMDYYFALKTMQDAQKLQMVEETIKDMGLSKFTAGLMYVIQTIFCLDGNRLLCKPNQKIGKELIDDILDGGNFGKYGREQHDNNESSLRWVIRRFYRIIRLFKYDPIGAICRPLIRIRLAIWSKSI